MKKCANFLLSFLLIFCFTAVPVSAAGYEPKDFQIYSNIALLVNLDDASKPVLYSKNAEVKTSPASLTKMVTTAVALKYIKENNKSLDDKMTVSYEDIHSLDGTGSSMGGLKDGEILTVEQLLYLIMIHSANEACNTIARYVAGGEEAFVQQMNDWVVKIGCKNTHFMNCHGLDEDNHYSTAVDLAKIAEAAMEYPEFMTISNTSVYTLPPTNLVNKERAFPHRNSMLSPMYKSYYYKYAKGIKTGTTDNAGHCVVTVATNNGYNYLCVVVQGKIIQPGTIPLNSAFVDAKNLFEWAFEHFKFKTVSDVNQMVGEVKVNNAKGERDFVQLYPEKNLSALVPSTLDSSSVLMEINQEKTPSSLDAPVKKGQQIGEANIQYAGQTIATVKLVAGENAERSNFLFVMNTIKKILKSIWAKIAIGILLLLLLFYIIVTILYNRKKKRERIRLVKDYRKL